MPRPARKLWSALLAALALGCAACAPSESPPNLLVLLVDDVGRELLSVYAEGPTAEALPRTPNIERLAAAGVRFERAWAYPLCSPTRATIQTGRYGFRTGVGGVIRPDGPALPLDEVTLPELLESALPGQYRTGAFGKWHLGNGGVGGLEAPRHAGYQHFAGSLGNLVGNQSYTDWDRVEDGLLQRSSAYATSDAVDACLRFVQSSEQPWLAYVAFQAAHAPLHVPPAELLDEGRAPGDEPLEQVHAMVEALDRELGRLLDGLGEDALERCVVVFASDNGTSPLAHGLGAEEGRGKGTLWEGGLSVPLIVAGAGVAEPGRSSAALVSTVDLYATLAEMVGVDARAHLPAGRVLDSISFAPVLAQAGPGSPRKTLYAEIFHPNGHAPQGAWRAVRGKRYKLLVREPSGQRFLYDLEEDPGERRDLLGRGTPSQRTQGAYARLSRELSLLMDDL